MIDLPEPELVRDAVLGSVVEARSHPSAIAAVACTPGFKLTHMRADTDEGPVDRLDILPPATAIAHIVEESALYAGPYLPHFGHMLAEFIHRLWAAKYFAHLQPTKIVFQSPALASFPGWLDEIFAACGIERDRVLFVDKPTIFKSLYVPAQGRALGGITLIDGYEQLFPLVPVAVSVDTPKKIYVSRSKHIRTGTYLGESLIEALLAQAGFAIVHPEEIPMATLLGILRGAEALVVAEGSALHNLELLGRVDAAIMVISRREGVRRRFAPLLAQLASRVRFFSRIQSMVPLEWDDNGPRARSACSIIPLGDLAESIADFTGSQIRQPTYKECDEAIASDLVRFLLDQRSGLGSTDAQLGRALRAIRADPAIARHIEGLAGY